MQDQVSFDGMLDEDFLAKIFGGSYGGLYSDAHGDDDDGSDGELALECLLQSMTSMAKLVAPTLIMSYKRFPFRGCGHRTASSVQY